MRRILVPTDFSEQADDAFDVALRLARKTGAAIKLLHVVDVLPTTANFSATGDVLLPGNMEQVYTMQLMEQAQQQIRKIANSRSRAGVDVVYEVEIDRVVHSIKRKIKEDHVDLVVMGSKGASGWDEFLIGSNTEKVVRSADCPVLTVKQAMATDDIKEVVLASDFKREVGPAMAHFKAFQRLFNARVHLVYVNTPGAFEATGNLRRKLTEFAKRHGLQNYSVNVYNDTVEEDGILHFAEDIKADLIMMATHGRTGFAHLLSGSIAEDLVNHSNIPVLTVHLNN